MALMVIHAIRLRNIAASIEALQSNVICIYHMLCVYIYVLEGMPQHFQGMCDSSRWTVAKSNATLQLFFLLFDGSLSLKKY